MMSYTETTIICIPHKCTCLKPAFWTFFDPLGTVGHQKKWVASYDGFYLTRGHYSNNSSGTLHDYITGNIAWFTHRTKRGNGHNWEGTSNGMEGSMFDELLNKAKDEGFVIDEIVTDKNTSGNAIFCNYFPEGSITYCSNHSAKKTAQRVTE